MPELLSKDMLADLVINIVNILILFLVTRALLYKPVKKYLAARREKAAAESREAQLAKEQARAEQAKYEALLADVEAEKSSVIGVTTEEARKAADEITRKAMKQAEAIVADANENARDIRKKAARDSKDAITEIALEISGKLMGRTVTDADNRRIVDSFFAE